MNTPVLLGVDLAEKEDIVLIHTVQMVGNSTVRRVVVTATRSRIIEGEVIASITTDSPQKT